MKKLMLVFMAYPFILNPYTNTYDYVGLTSGTSTQIANSTPTATMQFIGCSNCVNTRICVSNSSFTVGAYISASSPTVGCQ